MADLSDIVRAAILFILSQWPRGGTLAERVWGAAIHVDQRLSSKPAPRAYTVSFFLAQVFLPLACGGVIYLGWRHGPLRMHLWASAVGLGGLVESLRSITSVVSLPAPMRFSLPDALWAYAFVAHFLRLWSGASLARLVCAGGVTLLTVGSEVGQYFGVVPGTFDWVDLAFLMIATGGAVLVNLSPSRSG
jgi:hypothetical protein